MTFGVEELILDASRVKGKDGSAQPGLERNCRDVWAALCRWIVESMEKGKGVSVPYFIRLSWRLEDGIDTFPKTYKPVWSLSENFMHVHKLLLHKHAARHVEDSFWSKMEEINFSKIAYRYSQCLSKDIVFVLTRRFFTRLGHAIAEGQKVSLDVGVGTIVASERKLNFFFKSDFSRRVVHKSGKALICNDADDAQVAERAAPDDASQIQMSDIRSASRHGVAQEDYAAEVVTLDDSYEASPGAKVAARYKALAASGDRENEAPVEDVKVLRTKAMENVAQAAVERAFKRYEQFLSEREEFESSNVDVGRARLAEAVAEEERKKHQKKLLDDERARELKEEIAKRQEKKKEQHKERLVDGFNYGGKQNSFPLEKDKEPEKQAKLQAQLDMRRVLMEQMEAKRIVAMRQAERDIVMQKAELANVERELEKDYVSTVSKRQEESQALLRAWDRQVRVKELHNKKHAGRPQSVADSQDNKSVSAQANAFLSKLDAKETSRVQRPDTSMSQKAYAMLTAAHNPKSSLLEIEE